MGYVACFKVNQADATCVQQLSIVTFSWSRRMAGFTAIKWPGMDASQRILLNMGGAEETITLRSYDVPVSQLQAVIDKIRQLLVTDSLAAKWWLEIRDESGATVLQPVKGGITDARIDAVGGSDKIEITLTFTIGT